MSYKYLPICFSCLFIFIYIAVGLSLSLCVSFLFLWLSVLLLFICLSLTFFVSLSIFFFFFHTSCMCLCTFYSSGLSVCLSSWLSIRLLLSFYDFVFASNLCLSFYMYRFPCLSFGLSVFWVGLGTETRYQHFTSTYGTGMYHTESERRFRCHAWAIGWNICPLFLRNGRKKHHLDWMTGSVGFLCEGAR